MTFVVPFSATFNSTSLMTTVTGEWRIVLQCVRGLDDTPAVRGKDTIIPGASGRTVRDRVRDRRIIELEGWVFGCGASDALQTDDLRDALEELRTLFDPTGDPHSLVIDLEDEVRTATITARAMNMVTSREDLIVARRVSVELEAVGADWVIA